MFSRRPARVNEHSMSSSSFTETLDYLRSQGIPCACTLRLSLDDLGTSKLSSFLSEHEGADNSRGHAVHIAHDDNDSFDCEGSSDGSGGSDDEDERDSSVFTIGAMSWLSRCEERAAQLLRESPSRSIYLRYSEANGRIGLMLRRLPLLMVSMRCASDGRVEIESARLRGHAPLSSSSDEVVQPKAHLGEGTGADVVRRVPATLDDWAASLLWMLLKVHRGPLLTLTRPNPNNPIPEPEPSFGCSARCIVARGALGRTVPPLMIPTIGRRCDGLRVTGDGSEWHLTRHGLWLDVRAARAQCNLGSNSCLDRLR